MALGFTVAGGSVPTEDLVNAMNEIMAGDDRSVAIVAGSLLETVLTDTLTRRVLEDKKITEELFRSTGALGAFATKIRMGKLLGIYQGPAYKDFEAVKNIRNKFAHTIGVNNFADDQITSWATNLKLCDRYVGDMDDRWPDSRTLAKIPIVDWPNWVFIRDRDNKLKDARWRYVLTVQVLLYGLSYVITSASLRITRTPQAPF